MKKEQKIKCGKRKALLLKAATILIFPIQREAKGKMVSFFLVSPSAGTSDSLPIDVFILEGQEQIHLHKKSVLRNLLSKYHQLMISSPWTIFWTVLSVVGKDEPMSTTDAPKNCIFAWLLLKSYQLLQSLIMKVIQIIKWPWKFLVRNEGTRIAILFCIFWVSPCSVHNPARHSPSSDSFQVTPPLSLYQSTYDEWLDRQFSRWLGIQTDKWEYTDPYLHPIQCIIACSVVSSFFSKRFLLAMAGRWSKCSSFEALLWYMLIQIVYSYTDDKPLVEKYPVSLGVSQAQSL